MRPPNGPDRRAVAAPGPASYHHSTASPTRTPATMGQAKKRSAFINEARDRLVLTGRILAGRGHLFSNSARGFCISRHCLLQHQGEARMIKRDAMLNALDRLLQPEKFRD